jgi:hypothetical protein
MEAIADDSGPRSGHHRSPDRVETFEQEALVTTSDPTPVADRVMPRWQDPTLPTADRVELLLEQMTLEE